MDRGPGGGPDPPRSGTTGAAGGPGGARSGCGPTLVHVTSLQGKLVRLRPASPADVPRLAEIRRTPEVYAGWRGGDDMVAAVG
jgi:hypothetical protein